jgi:hypothetical protein
VDEGEQGKVLGCRLSWVNAWRIDQHAFDGGAEVDFTAVGLALRKIEFGFSATGLTETCQFVAVTLVA